MRRRDLMVLCGRALLAQPLLAQAQQPARIGYLTAGKEVNEQFRDGLREFGYVEGQNVAIELRAADFKLERLPQLARELTASRVDVIVTVSTPAALAAKQATSTIPIVMATAADPVGSGLIKSLAHPGGNITGLSFQGDEVLVKGLELLKETAPGARKVALITNPEIDPERRALPRAINGGRRLGMEIRPFVVRKTDDFEAAFAAVGEWHADALSALESSLISAEPSRKRILAYAARQRLATMFGSRLFAAEGALLAYGIDFAALHRRSAYFVDRILKGTKPADLPVEQPTKFALVVNLKTAKALGLTVPPLILARADEVIE